MTNKGDTTLLTLILQYTIPYSEVIPTVDNDLCHNKEKIVIILKTSNPINSLRGTDRSD